jgi:hypothetical protein
MLIGAGRFDAAISFLNKNGVQCAVPESEADMETLVKAVDIKFKNRLAKFREISSRYRELTSAKGEKPTRQYYNRLIITLSISEIVKIQLNPKKMTVAEFAGYLSMYNEYQNHLKIRKHDRKH